jgi:hypothetical protein
MLRATANVAGVFVNWTYDEAHQVDEINMAMTGDMIIRIAEGVTVARGDLLMSAGDGTAKPQGDDIVRSKTVAKVTSTHVTCTYEDGSYCVTAVVTNGLLKGTKQMAKHAIMQPAQKKSLNWLRINSTDRVWRSYHHRRLQ